MNRFILILSLAAAFPAAAQRQTIGVQAGIGNSWIRSEAYLNAGATELRLNLGLSYERFFGRHLSIGADLLYQQRGSSEVLTVLKYGAAPVSARVPNHYNYAALPLKLGYRSGGRAFGFGKIGLVPALLLRAYYDRPELLGFRGDHIDLKAATRSFDLAGIAEAGGGFRLSDKCSVQAALAFQYSATAFTDPFYWSLHYGLSVNAGFCYGFGGGARPAAPVTGG